MNLKKLRELAEEQAVNTVPPTVCIEYEQLIALLDLVDLQHEGLTSDGSTWYENDEAAIKAIEAYDKFNQENV
jgi:hypothetical protein